MGESESEGTESPVPWAWTPEFWTQFLEALNWSVHAFEVEEERVGGMPIGNLFFWTREDWSMGRVIARVNPDMMWHLVLYPYAPDARLTGYFWTELQALALGTIKARFEERCDHANFFMRNPEFPWNTPIPKIPVRKDEVFIPYTASVIGDGGIRRGPPGFGPIPLGDSPFLRFGSPIRREEDDMLDDAARFWLHIQTSPGVELSDEDEEEQPSTSSFVFGSKRIEDTSQSSGSGSAERDWWNGQREIEHTGELFSIPYPNGEVLENLAKDLGLDDRREDWERSLGINPLQNILRTVQRKEILEEAFGKEVLSGPNAHPDYIRAVYHGWPNMEPFISLERANYPGPSKVFEPAMREIMSTYVKFKAEAEARAAGREEGESEIELQLRRARNEWFTTSQSQGSSSSSPISESEEQTLGDGGDMSGIGEGGPETELIVSDEDFSSSDSSPGAEDEAEDGGEEEERKEVLKCPPIIEINSSRYRSYRSLKKNVKSIPLPPEVEDRNYLCVFCKGNNEEPQIYKSHPIKIDGKVTCPYLRTHVCQLCKATGDLAHTIKYCPQNRRGFFAMKALQKAKQNLKSGDSEDGSPRALSSGSSSEGMLTSNESERVIDKSLEVEIAASIDFNNNSYSGKVSLITRDKQQKAGSKSARPRRHRERAIRQSKRSSAPDAATGKGKKVA